MTYHYLDMKICAQCHAGDVTNIVISIPNSIYSDIVIEELKKLQMLCLPKSKSTIVSAFSTIFAIRTSQGPNLTSRNVVILIYTMQYKS